MGPPAILERQHIRRERHAGHAQPEEWLGRRCLLPFEWLGARLPSRRQSLGAIDRSLQALVIRRARNSHKDAGQHRRPEGAADLHGRPVDRRGAAGPLPRHGIEDHIGYGRYDGDVTGTQQDQRQQHLPVGRFRGKPNQQAAPGGHKHQPRHNDLSRSDFGRQVPRHGRERRGGNHEWHESQNR